MPFARPEGTGISEAKFCLQLAAHLVEGQGSKQRNPSTIDAAIDTCRDGGQMEAELWEWRDWGKLPRDDTGPSA